MQGKFSMTLVLLVVLMVTVEVGHKHGDKKSVPNAGDCGDGFCEATCGEHTTKQCNIPCNWKKAFGGKSTNVGNELWS
ncbi:midkine b [Salvelinus fontinalis]|uniref:midkine b n=1 Tax=Salvelinus fontinalis TaxID=8038 RepID=UPI0024868C46|nr:midkine b [Salvelinus fontinalis]